MEDFFNTRLKEKQISSYKFDYSRSCTTVDNLIITETLDKESGLKKIEMPLHFIRGNFGNADLPKMLLHVSFSFYKSKYVFQYESMIFLAV